MATSSRVLETHYRLRYGVVKDGGTFLFISLRMCFLSACSTLSFCMYIPTLHKSDPSPPVPPLRHYAINAEMETRMAAASRGGRAEDDGGRRVFALYTTT